MQIVRNLDHMRVCDVSDDGRRIIIRLKRCITIIYVDKHGVCHIYNKRTM